jgi:hypothetical protein
MNLHGNTVIGNTVITLNGPESLYSTMGAAPRSAHAVCNIRMTSARDGTEVTLMVRSDSQIVVTPGPICAPQLLQIADKTSGPNTILSFFNENYILEDAEYRKLIAAAAIQGVRIDTLPPSGRTFTWAIEIGYDDWVRATLRRGDDVNQNLGSNLTALHYATRAGYAGIVAILLEHGANTEAHDYAGRTALGIAIGYSRLEIARLLINAGASFEICPCYALDAVAHVGGQPFVNLLLDSGADPERSRGWRTQCWLDDQGTRRTVAVLVLEDEFDEIELARICGDYICLTPERRRLHLLRH